MGKLRAHFHADNFLMSRGKRQRSERLAHALVKFTLLPSSCCFIFLLICFAALERATALPDRALRSPGGTFQQQSRHHVPKWKPTRVHSPAFSDAAPAASVDSALVTSSTSNSSTPHGRVETNFELSSGVLFPPPVQRDRRMLFMINAYHFNATESHVINTLQTLTSWCERGEEVHVALYTTSRDLASYVSDSTQRFFCQRLSSPLPIAVLEYDKNVTINIAGMHRYLVAEKIDEYDWFLYTEDDLALTDSHVRFLQKWTRILGPKGTLPHLMRYEVASVRPLGLRRDALLLDEYPLPLSLYRMDVTDSEMEARGLHLRKYGDELDDDEDDDHGEETSLRNSGRAERDCDERTILLKDRGDATSLSGRRRRRRDHTSRRKDVGERGEPQEGKTTSLSFMKSSRVPNPTSSSTSQTAKKGTTFVRVPNPYMAMWLLPRDMLLPHVREPRWFDEINDCPNPDVRVHFATFWLLPHFSFAVPLSSMRRALIHHVSTKYAGHGLMQVDADRRQTSHPFFLHMFFNVDAWDLERTLSECIEDGRDDGAGGGNDNNNGASDASVRSSNVLPQRDSSTYESLVQKEHPSGIALQTPRLLRTSPCSSCLDLGGNVTISVAKREKGEPLEYTADCLRPAL